MPLFAKRRLDRGDLAFFGLNAATISSSYTMEDVRPTLDWMRGYSIFPAFDPNDGFFLGELTEDFRDYTAVRTVLGLLKYVMLPRSRKNSPPYSRGL